MRILSVILTLPAVAFAQADFANFETPPVHPLDLSPDGALLAVAHTAQGRVEILSLNSTGTPSKLVSLPAGVDPVSVRWRTATEVWVVNHWSDTVSVLDVPSRTVLHTLATDDEPCDVVFAGTPPRAFVSCSQANSVLVFNPASLSTPSERIAILGEDPRALAVSPDGTRVYAAIFESGNSTTILGGGGDGDIIDFPPNAVSDAAGPYNGVNPPPNSGSSFLPVRNTAAGTPPPVGLIVRKNAAGAWMDDNGRNWTSLVSGANAAKSGRPQGWDVLDNDVAVIDAGTLGVTYARRMMNLCMAIAVNPATGRVTVAGTEATNEVRFEPNVNGKFVRVNMGYFDAPATAPVSIRDLNSHLTYAAATVAQAERDKSLGDPRAIVWMASGAKGFVAGMGSDNVLVIDPSGVRIQTAPVEVGRGPCGLAVSDTRQRLYVWNRFDSTVSVIDTASHAELSRTALFDPTPPAIRDGRAFLYDTHRTSGLGQAACASCHADARMDRLAWDLGDPAGSVKNVSGTGNPPRHNLGAGIPGLTDNFTNFHPMKGPMTTQTLQDIIGKEPHHWRGDRDGIEEFNAAFTGLLGDDVMLTPAEMQAFENFLATVRIPPNPFRNTDNTLPANLPLPGHYRTGRFGSAGQPLPNGNAQRALSTLYRPISRGIDRGTFACVTCHTAPTGMGPDRRFNQQTLQFNSILPGPNGERHHALVSVDGSSQRAIKTPQLRNLYDKVGFEMTQTVSRSGFGFGHDGAVDSIARFMSEGAFTPNSDQDIADLVALMLSFSGSEFGPAVQGEPPGTASMDAPAAVGKQAHLIAAGTPAADAALLNQLITLASAGKIDLVAHASLGGVPRGWHFTGGAWQTDQFGITETLSAVLARASVSSPVTFTALLAGSGRRVGIERDRDGLLDFDETRDLALNVPGVQNPFRPDAFDATGNNGSLSPDGISDSLNDFDGDGVTNAAEFTAGTNPADQLTVNPPMNTAITSAPGGALMLTWHGAPLGEYEITWTTDFMVWTPIGSGRRTALPGGGPMIWTDNGPPDTPSPPQSSSRRFYRVERVR
jgi:YVTN family beta-propeller protein